MSISKSTCRVSALLSLKRNLPSRYGWPVTSIFNISPGRRRVGVPSYRTGLFEIFDPEATLFHVGASHGDARNLISEKIEMDLPSIALTI
jgi:hypothetical protein